MKILACIGSDCSFAIDRLRAAGHEVVVLDDEVMFDEAVQAYRSENPDVFFWNPGAPIHDVFWQVERFMHELINPPIIIFNVMTREWTEYCGRTAMSHVRVVGFSTENFDADLQAVVQQ